MNSNYICLAVKPGDCSLKRWKLLYIKKKVTRHINDNLSDFPSSDYSENGFFEGAIFEDILINT